MRDTELAGLAMTLGKDHGMTITVGGDNSYCSTDGSRINIARMPSTELGRRLMCGLIFHEVGHKNHTSGDKPAGLVGELTNVIEDLRVEKLTMQERPGTRFDLEAVTDYYAKKHSFTPNSVPAALLGLVMAVGRGQFLGQKSLLNWTTLCRRHLEASFDAELADHLESCLTRNLPVLTTTRCSQNLANELLTLIRNQAQQQPPAMAIPEAKPPENGKTNADSRLQQFQEVQECEENRTDSDASSASYKTTTPAAATGSSPGSHSLEQIEELLAADSGDPGNIQKFLTEELNRMAAHAPQEVRNGLPEYPEISRINPLRGGHLKANQALITSSRLRTRLPGLLQSLKQVPICYGTSGRKLATNRLIHFANGNPKIFRKKSATVAVNTAVVILLDNSGSMYAKPAGASLFSVANPAAFALHHCLWGLSGVNVSSIAFADPDHGTALQLLCGFGEKPQGEQFDLPPDGGTPTHTALWYSRAALLQRHEPRKIILLLTDGQPNDPDQTRQATRRCGQDGIEIVAIGILNDAVKQYWDHHQVIEQLQDLPRAMFAVMEQALASH